MGNALGRGFESLIPTELFDEEFDPTNEEDEKVSELREVNIDEVVPDEEQARKEFDAEALEALAQSIRVNGILQPIVVTREDGKYKIVAGERRWRAAKLAGLTKVQVIVRTIDAQNRLEMSVIENAQREDLNPIELGTAYAKLKAQFNLSLSEIASRVGKSEASIVNMVRLLRLPDDVKKIMIKEKLSEGVMRPLVAVENDLLYEVLPKIVAEGWTARKVERYIAEHKKKSSASIVKKNVFAKYEEKISKKYSAYKATTKVHGRSVTITCESKEKLEELLKKI